MASVNRYKAILKEVAADLEIEADSELCAHVATLRMVREGIQARILRGERVAVDDVLALDQAPKAYLPERKTPHIQVSFVEGVVGHYKCTKCGEENRLEEGTYTPAKPPAPPFRFRCKCGAQTEFNASGPFTDGGNPGVPVEAPAPKLDEKVVPLVTHRPGVSASSFHSAVLNNREIPPLKKEQPAIYTSQRPSDPPHGSFRDDPHPYARRAVAHKLPS